MKRLLLLLPLLIWGSIAVAGPTRIEGVRSWAGPDHTRVVFDLSAPVKHRLFKLDDPARVVVDLANTRVDPSIIASLQAEGVLRDVRSGRRKGGDLRVVFDLNSGATPKSFLVRPNDTYGDRLVVDLEKPRGPGTPVKQAPRNRRDLVVAIDPGHGGKDPGAIGRSGTREKNVVLHVSRKLASLINQQAGMRAVLTRDTDIFLPLRERTRRAHDKGADLFISIHADSFRDRRVTGSSVYALSSSGASSEMARMLAAQENSVDRIGGVSLEDKDDVVASVLVDLSRAATIESGSSLAQSLLGELDEHGDVHRKKVGRAGFVVLKSLDMPSALVELGFLTNPREERRLNDGDYQWRLARAVEKGVSDFTRKHMPDMRLAASGDTYVVQSGDTLSGIAQRYEVSVPRLRRVNELRGDTIMVGSSLTIP